MESIKIRGMTDVERLYRLEVLQKMIADPDYGGEVTPIERATITCEHPGCNVLGTHYYADIGALIYVLCKNCARIQHQEAIARYKLRYGL